MLSYEDVGELLALQARAYGLLRWLGEASVDDPELLGEAFVSRPADWLAAHRAALPGHLTAPGEAFANLFVSFFETSFHVERLVFDDRLVSARIVLGAGDGRTPDRTGLVQSQALAVKHLAASQGRPLGEGQARELVRQRPDLREAVLLWTYVWELDRRARNKGKGPVAHRIWRSLSWETKRDLTAEQVWAARQRILDAAAAPDRAHRRRSPPGPGPGGSAS